MFVKAVCAKRFTQWKKNALKFRCISHGTNHVVVRCAKYVRKGRKFVCAKKVRLTGTKICKKYAVRKVAISKKAKRSRRGRRVLRRRGGKRGRKARRAYVKKLTCVKFAIVYPKAQCVRRYKVKGRRYRKRGGLKIRRRSGRKLRRYRKRGGKRARKAICTHYKFNRPTEFCARYKKFRGARKCTSRKIIYGKKYYKVRCARSRRGRRFARRGRKSAKRCRKYKAYRKKKYAKVKLMNIKSRKFKRCNKQVIRIPKKAVCVRVRVNAKVSVKVRSGRRLTAKHVVVHAELVGFQAWEKQALQVIENYR